MVKLVSSGDRALFQTNCSNHLFFLQSKSLFPPLCVYETVSLIRSQLLNQISFFPSLRISGKLLIVYVCAQLLKLCLTPCDPKEYSLPGSSVHGILLARILEEGAMPFFREFSRPRDHTHVSCTADRFFTHSATWETQLLITARQLQVYRSFPLGQSGLAEVNNHALLSWAVKV